MIFCCGLRLKRTQISELSQKRDFNGYPGVIGYGDSKYNIINRGGSMICLGGDSPDRASKASDTMGGHGVIPQKKKEKKKI